MLALDELRPLFFEVGLVHRLLLLAAQVGALLIMVPSLRMVGTGDRSERQTSPWWRAGFWASWLAAVILVISLFANLVGRVSLSELLTSATLASFRYALVLFVGALVLDGLVMVLLGTPRAQSRQLDPFAHRASAAAGYRSGSSLNPVSVDTRNPRGVPAPRAGPRVV